MKEYLEKLPQEIQGLLQLAGDIAYRDKFAVYLVGGFVRDLILGVKNFDIDIIVECNGIKFAEDMAQALKAKVITHKRFGTATITLDAGVKIDIATVRKEFYPQPACLPEVSAGTLKDDLFRRDFTINAMAVSICRENFGRLIDSFGGRDDLRDKKIRVMHNLSFIDDPTRILRAIRFAARYDFTVEPHTLRLLKEAVKLNMLHRVQPQRVRDEIILLLKEGHPVKQLRYVQKLVKFTFISPGLCLTPAAYRFLNAIEKEVSWFKEALPSHRQLDVWLIYFMGLIDSLKFSQALTVCRNFVFRRGEEKRIFAYKRISAKLIRALSYSSHPPEKIFHLFEPLSYEVLIILKAKYKNHNFQRNIDNFLRHYHCLRIHVSGHDLRNLGITPGPHYQKILRKVLNAKLNGRVKTKEEELAFIRRLI